MDNITLFKFADSIFKDCLNTLKAKNHDYATGEKIESDALKNFNLVNYLGITDSSTGILVRMCDKMSRLANVYKGGNQVKDESCIDTCKDLINYTVIFLATLKDNKDV
jgi:hypothetical protein